MDRHGSELNISCSELLTTLVFCARAGHINELAKVNILAAVEQIKQASPQRIHEILSAPPGASEFERPQNDRQNDLPIPLPDHESPPGAGTQPRAQPPAPEVAAQVKGIAMPSAAAEAPPKQPQRVTRRERITDALIKLADEGEEIQHPEFVDKPYERTMAKAGIQVSKRTFERAQVDALRRISNGRSAASDKTDISDKTDKCRQ